MSKKKRIWMIVFASVLLTVVLIVIWQMPTISRKVEEMDYGKDKVEPIITSSPTELIDQPTEPAESDNLSEPPTETPEKMSSTEVTEASESETAQSEQATSQHSAQVSEPTESKESEKTESTESETVESTESETVDQTESEETVDLQTRIDELIAMVYALRDEYTARLSAIEQAGISEYNALPSEEKTDAKKREIAMGCVDKAYALEKECDGRIDAICLELGVLLLKTDGDMALINEIRFIYASEKTAAKNELTERYRALLG